MNDIIDNRVNDVRDNEREYIDFVYINEIGVLRSDAPRHRGDE